MENKKIDLIVAKIAGRQAGKVVVQHIEKLIKAEKEKDEKR